MSWDFLDEEIYEMAEEGIKDLQDIAGESMMERVTTITRNKQQGKTPVDSGNLVANTIVSVGTPDYSTNDRLDPDGFETYARGLKVIQGAGPFSKIYIQNNTEYNLQAEYIGWSNTPSYGYFRVSIEATLDAVENAK